MCDDDDVTDLIAFCVTAKGCLFNIRRDPAEKHDLWQKANTIATRLSNRLRALWAQQVIVAHGVIEPAADPANFGYTWMPWLDSSVE